MKRRLLLTGVLLLLALSVVMMIYYSKTRVSESFVDIPHDIRAEYREDVSDFLSQYSALADKVCQVQMPVIDGIAKTNAGTAGETPDLAAAQSRAKEMAGGPIFNCTSFQQQKKALANDPLTIKDLYTVIDDIPDNIGLRLYNSAKFSLTQLNGTYDQIQGSLSLIKEGFDPKPNQTTCKSSELCPDEMVKEIVLRYPKLKASLDQTSKGFLPDTTPIDELIKKATDKLAALNKLKSKAMDGTLIASTVAAETKPQAS